MEISVCLSTVDMAIEFVDLVKNCHLLKIKLIRINSKCVRFAFADVLTPKRRGRVYVAD